MTPENQSAAARAFPFGVRTAIAAVLLALTLLAPRALILHRSDFTRWPTCNPVVDLIKLGIAGGYDAGFAAGLAAVFLIALAALSGRLIAARSVYAIFLFLTTICVVLAVAHTRVLSLQGRPLNYQWLYYADFLRSVDSHEVLLASVDPKLIAAIVVCAAAYLLASVVLGAWVQRRIAVPDWAFAAAVVFGLLLWSLLAQAQARRQKWDEARLVNPVYYFAQSCVVTRGQPKLFTMPAMEFEAHPRGRHADFTSLKAATQSGIKHLLLFVLESTPAEYLGVYGSKSGATPNLDRWAKHAAVFENIYAHAPATNKGLFSILCSAYPWISYKSESEEKPDLSCPSIATELRDHGYATAFFASGSLEFQKAGEFLRFHGFELLQDYKNRRNSRTIFRSEKWPFLDGSDDVSTAESLATWFQDRHKAARPIFGMLWTNMTHYPYFTEATLQRFGADENLLNRYLNALHTGDMAFATVMRSLETAGILGETLVVVVGDHGEAFGPHNQVGHASGIYEENCHVPLLLINPALFSGQRYATIGGLIDIAPTVMEILGRPAPSAWQGSSLFETDRPDRTYFFSPWFDYLFGFREGNMKFLYNATRDQYEVYDLARDPEERQNRIVNYRHITGQSLSRLAGWVQHQDQLFRQLISH